MTLSAMSLGAGPLRSCARVHLPLVRPGVAVALVLVAIDAIKELPIVLLLRPFGFTTVSVWVYQLAGENFWEKAALPALVIVARPWSRCSSCSGRCRPRPAPTRGGRR